jgi:hypothetical protein
LFLGLTVMLDVRLLGVRFRTLPVTAFLDRVLPWVFGGFAIMVATGLLLFYANPVKTWLNIFFRLKLCFLLLAGLNALIFHQTIGRSVASWDLHSEPPFRARLAGAISLTLWAAIVIAGRLIAYNWFDKGAAASLR